MELPKFKLSLSGIYSKKDTSNSLVFDENAETKMKVPLSERKAQSPLREGKHPFTPQVNGTDDSPQRKPTELPPSLRISSQPTDLMLLHLESSSKGEESILTIEDNSLSLDNQEFYTGNCTKRRMISKLDIPFERERKMSQTLTEFMKTSTEIKKELKDKQITDPDKSLFEGSLAQALSPHFPHGAPTHFSKSSEDETPDALLSSANLCLTQAGLSAIESAQASDARFLLQLIVDALSRPLLQFNREVDVSQEDTEIFQQLFGRKAVATCQWEQTLLRLISFYHAQVSVRDEEARDLSRELESKAQTLRAVERESKKNAKLLGDKIAILEKTVAELRSELVEMKVAADRLRGENELLSSERKPARSRSPISTASGGEAQAVLAEICKILSIKHQHHILKSIAKLEKVVRAVPRLERFIREVCSQLFPGFQEDPGKKPLNTDIDALSRRLKEWTSEVKSLRAFRGSVCHFLNVAYQTAEEDLLQLMAQRSTDEGEFAQRFRQVFELSDDENIFNAVDQIFFQHHELRTFFRRVKQFLGVSEECSVSSLLLLVKQLKRR